MSEASMNYDRSNMSPGAGRSQDELRTTADKQGNWVYPSSLSSTGHTEIVLPAANGRNGEVRMLVKDFGAHVVREIERSFEPTMYRKSFPTKSATETFRHYLGAAKGASLMDAATLKRFESLAADFEREPEQEEFFKQVVRPSLHDLTPKRR